jgi:2-aminoadipate transaminase
MQDALLLSARPGIISFALGLPSPELFPVEQFTNACAGLLPCNPSVLQYGPPSGALKSHIVSLMQMRGIECSEGQVFLTSGAQQAVNLIVALLLEPGRPVIAEELCYPGFRQIVEFYKPEILTVPTDLNTGMDVDKVEWYLTRGERPAFIYTIPDGHNPLGVSLSEEKRKRLVSLSQEYGIPIIEEDPYGFLSYDECPLLPMRARQADRVFYVGSFSKILAPSLRVGWLIVPEALIPYLAILKESSDIDMATFAQHLVARMLDSGFLPKHLNRLRLEYKGRRDVMLGILSKRFPRGSQWTTPDSGVFVWVRLPEIFDTMGLLDVAVKGPGVAFMPGPVFGVERHGRLAASSLRMNFSYLPPTCIEDGMVRLEELFRSVSSSGVTAC